MGLRRTGLRQLRTQRLRLRQQRLHLRQIEPRGCADFEAAREDALRFLARGDGAAGQRDALVEFAQYQVAIGDLGDQRQLEGARGGIGAEIALECGVLKAAHAAPEIKLPGVRPKSDLVLAGGHRLAADVEVAGHARAAHVRRDADGGPALGALDAVCRFGFPDAQHGRAQVAVVLQRLREQRLQARIGELSSPVDQRRLCTGQRCWSVRRVGRGHHRRRHLQRGGHRAAATKQPYAACTGERSGTSGTARKKRGDVHHFRRWGNRHGASSAKQ